MSNPDGHWDETTYIEGVRSGGPQERLAAVRQLTDEVMPLPSLQRMRDVFEAIGDTAGLNLVNECATSITALNLHLERAIEVAKLDVPVVSRPKWIYD